MVLASRDPYALSDMSSSEDDNAFSRVVRNQVRMLDCVLLIEEKADIFMQQLETELGSETVSHLEEERRIA